MQLVRELRGHGRIDGEAANAAVLDAAQHFDQAFEVHRFLQHVLHHFVDERMVGNLDVAVDGLEAGGGLRKDAGEQVFGAGALNLRRDALALGEAQQLQAAVRRPSASAS